MIHGPFIEPADHKQKEKEIRLIEEATREAFQDRDKLLRMLHRTGMFTKRGKLKKQFQ
ncbi:hypothetical protein [Cerasicoccus fimbriatus]|uniref:hypothetical protein n=1 Tax=Cerasicoccus fimbriatus TaxID=3014554 RepID=UPI0022B41C1A|nr:hypothetical protein [Cerasicoccus sp. TK19100]